MVGVPLVVDNLMVTTIGLLFAHVCVQINTFSPMFDSVSTNLNGKKLSQEALYY